MCLNKYNFSIIYINSMSYNNYSKYNQYVNCCKPIWTTGCIT